VNSTQRHILAVSRILVAMIFLLNGLGIVSQAQAARELIEHGAAASLVPFLMLGARTLEIVAGVGLAFGIYPRLAAVGLLIFLVPTTVLAHAFWQVAGTATFTVQLLNFLKNTSMAGGLLFIGAPRSQPSLLPRASRSNARVPEKNERTPLKSVRAS
jgi:putative oxidoreductase